MAADCTMRFVISTLHIIYASTSGHTEYVVGVLKDFLSKKVPGLAVEVQTAESAKPGDLLRGDVLILASGTWNIAGTEGQMNPHMYEYLLKEAKDMDLSGKKVGIIALGDSRYYYTSRAGEHLRNYVQSHGGSVLGVPLTVINEPYGQEERVEKWGEKFFNQLSDL
ncbi:hypothetical protein A2454_03385 [Candidatus Peribacteria bacterium RIFOXYC2_FULL_55_14]|nr:MAG: hypothetical protein A2198_01760 [Candidatus Peribacteria bacterium RIFOXYA1_FULL_56_14]OGJ73841.1 MAG: hypothetical protein A2384_04705 [Candidatus Peribacteria bacterium RIFOXYB1_FULL_54_35]OGJ74969.1 MAG: hypothetical protein A2217_03175 [Candidatus Peribacteria bacterium RIFOXYA2_FULL_55_28]OGJ77256.1 MAG: hypothetical protein A2327_06280 [Candidatus Peribacteria bacterium RIFOXYB2_FULL_54_17]OGJ79155.1 MAG: hypothetical protein A2424_03030 [Candidatus Peribacteria bacterium RIFOXYC